VQCVGVHYHVEEQYVSPLGISHKMHVSFSGAFEHKLLAASFLGKKSISMHPLAF
jgi:hypothetical protein